jgi:hypothetical protein
MVSTNIWGKQKPRCPRGFKDFLERICLKVKNIYAFWDFALTKKGKAYIINSIGELK